MKLKKKTSEKWSEQTAANHWKNKIALGHKQGSKQNEKGYN